MSQGQIVQGDCHFKVILCEMLFLYLEGALVEFLRLFEVFEVSVGDAQVPQSECHFAMVRSEMPLLYLEGALVHFLRLFVVFEVTVRVTQVVQSTPNAARIITEFLEEDLQVIILFYLQCPLEELLLLSVVPEHHVGV